MTKSVLRSLVAASLATAILFSPGLVRGQDDAKPSKPAKTVVAKDDAKPKPKAEEAPATPKADEAKPKAAPTKLELPKGTPEEQLDFVIEQFEKGPEARTRASIVKFLEELTPLSGDVADNLLTNGENDVAVLQGVEMRVQLLKIARRFGVVKSNKKLDAFIKRISADKRPTIVKFAKFSVLSGKVNQIVTLQGDARLAVVNDVIKHVTDAEEIDGSSMQLATAAVRMLGYSNDYELAAKTADQLAELIAASDNPRYARSGRYMAGSARRFRLPGHEMKLTGKTHDGEKFDWATYRGKVVLVDFWATWCGPCIAELPNVQANFEKYHGKGFEVVGISIDDDQERLNAFLERRQLPWVNLFDPADDNPNAAYYGVSSIPNTMLVGKDGKVLELNVRGRKLGELLAKHLGPIEEDPKTTKKGKNKAAEKTSSK